MFMSTSQVTLATYPDQLRCRLPKLQLKTLIKPAPIIITNHLRGICKIVITLFTILQVCNHTHAAVQMVRRC
jgi:hypothetical protein